MATRALQQVLAYVAWNTSTNAYVTGDSANHSTSWCKDGTRSATTNATAEVDATNLPGLYKVTMTSTETDCIEGVLGGKSTTANVVLIPTMVAFDYLNTSAPAAAGVPDVNVKSINNAAAATPGAAGGVFIAGTNAATTITTGLTAHIIGTVDTLTTYTGNTPQTGDNFPRLGAPAGASIAADLAEIEGETDTLITGVNVTQWAGQNALLDANNLPKVDVEAINASTLAAQALAQMDISVCWGTCSGGTTTTAVVSALSNPASLTDAGQLIGRTIIFLGNSGTANMQAQASNITASTTGATPTITFTAMTHAPANGDKFVIV